MKEIERKDLQGAGKGEVEKRKPMVRPRPTFLRGKKCADKWAGTHTSEGWAEPCSLSAASTWHVERLEALRPSQMPKFANIIVSMNLSLNKPFCRGFLQSLDEGYPGAMDIVKQPCKATSWVWSRQTEGLAPIGWVKRKPWNTIIIC